MKRFISIIFIFILFLNVFGYYGVFLGLQYRNERSAQRIIEADSFKKSELITLKIPMSVPYMPDRTVFEKVTGKFEHQGELYRLVKQKYEKDTITIVCIKDAEHKKIGRVLSDYAKTFTDTPGTQRPSKMSNSFLKEYLPLEFSIQPVSHGWVIGFRYAIHSAELLDRIASTITQPPELA